MGTENRLPPEIDRFVRQVLDKRTGFQLDKLIEGYRLTTQSEGTSKKMIDLVVVSLRHLERFLATSGLSLDVTGIGVEELRRFINYLQEQPRFAHHPFTPPQDEKLSGYTVNGYLRGLRNFWAWLTREGFIDNDPFYRMRIPAPPQKVIPIFTEEQLYRYFSGIDISTTTGYRNYTIILALLDTGVRCSELINLPLPNVNLESRIIQVLGKGNKERQLPIGAKLQKALWKYINFHRPEPAIPRYQQVFLTHDGHPLTKDRLEAIVKRYGIKAGITGIRVSPHTFRHTMAVMFLRNGGDVFSLQRILGHSQLDTVKLYLNLTMVDISRVHRNSSPADNLDLKISQQRKGGRTIT